MQYNTIIIRSCKPQWYAQPNKFSISFIYKLKHRNNNTTMEKQKEPVNRRKWACNQCDIENNPSGKEKEKKPKSFICSIGWGI